MMDLAGWAVRGTACLHTLGILVAVGAGFYAAAKAKKAGVPPLGPIVLTVGVALLGATALVFTVVDLAFSEAYASLLFQLLALGAMSMDALGTLLVIAGLVLLRRPAPRPEAAS